jgi:hypothetical protein
MFDFRNFVKKGLLEDDLVEISSAIDVKNTVFDEVLNENTP